MKVFSSNCSCFLFFKMPFSKYSFHFLLPKKTSCQIKSWKISRNNKSIKGDIHCNAWFFPLFLKFFGSFQLPQNTFPEKRCWINLGTKGCGNFRIEANEGHKRTRYSRSKFFDCYFSKSRRRLFSQILSI